MSKKYYFLGLAMLCGTVNHHASAADSIAEALSSGKAYGNLRLRYESVEQDNALDDADALTLRTRIGYKTGSISGFSALVEFEDVRVVGGQDDFSVPPTGFQPGIFSVVADPETTELDQAFLQYKNDVVTAKLGAQVFVLDNHRFIGHVGWRQDRQTFDAISVKYTPTKSLTVTAANLYGRNRIFAEAADQDSNDNIFNIAYKTGLGQLTGYAYLLENDFGTDDTLDTVGVRFAGSTKSGDTKIHYEAEFASQEFDNNSGTTADTDYLFASVGATVSGVTVKLGYEVLGSDDGARGFATPLATLHKFNGFADLFLGTPATGLKDFYISAAAKVGPGKLAVIYHDFSADESTATLDDYGTELDVSYGFKINKNYFAGIKYADYSSDGFAVDTQKLSVWAGAKF